MQIKQGDIVGRDSYNNDILFFVDRILKINKTKKIAILKGINIRIEADAPIDDLRKLDAKKAKNFIRQLENLEYKQIGNSREKILESTGKILHLDGDKRYSEKTLKYYKKMGLNAVVKNIAESRQPQFVIPLLKKYQPDILVITGHDSMMKNGRNYFDIYNYMYAGADFASSPGRILIDFIDPIIVANKIATTEKNVYISAKEISKLIKEGEKGVSGIGTKGKKKLCKKLL